MPDPPTAAGVASAVAQYVRLRPELDGRALLLRHGGQARGWWRLVAVREELAAAVELYEREATGVRRGALVVWWRGGVGRACVAPAWRHATVAP